MKEKSILLFISRGVEDVFRREIYALHLPAGAADLDFAPTSFLSFSPSPVSPRAPMKTIISTLFALSAAASIKIQHPIHRLRVHTSVGIIFAPHLHFQPPPAFSNSMPNIWRNMLEKG